MRIAVVILLSALVGLLLSAPWIDWPLPEGLIGAGLMLAAAAGLRRHWQHRAQTRGDEPGEPEREVWHGLASTSLIGAHIATTLVLAGPGAALQDLAVLHHPGRTTWLLIGGAVASYFILHRREVQRDERDRAIAEQATRVSGLVLASLVVVLAVTLGFTPAARLAPMSHVFLAHLLLLALMLSSLTDHAVRLWGYRRDTLLARENAG